MPERKEASLQIPYDVVRRWVSWMGRWDVQVGSRLQEAGRLEPTH